MTKGEEVGQLLYEYDGSERTAGAVRKISLVQVQMLNIKLLLKGFFNETSLVLCLFKYITVSLCGIYC